MADEITKSRDFILSTAKLDLAAHLEDLSTERASLARNFTSDTVTAPSEEMYAYAIKHASVGDDVFRNDRTTNLLEKHVAQLTGKEAAIFLTSGTMSNQIALRTHLQQPPHSVVGDFRSHVYRYEAGGLAYHSQATMMPVVPSNKHHLTLKDIERAAVLETDIHFAPTKVITLENTLNGTIHPQEEILRIAAFAKEHDIKMHLDGARLWHVAISTGTPLSELCAPFDSVSLCFSKGLGAPFGSILVGTQAFIDKARWFRKLFGGAGRQTGILSASAVYALNNHLSLLAEVHTLAERLEKGLKNLGIKITSPAETCILFFDPSPIGVTYDELAQRALELPNPLILAGSRLVLHIQTSPQAVDDLLGLVETLKQEKLDAGFVYQSQEKDSLMADPYVRRKAK